MDAAQYQCHLCAKRYKRKEHLQRHSSSHTSDRPHRCPACDTTFQRTDVLKRHIRTCPGRDPGYSFRSWRQRSCARCIRLKKACSSAQPCQRCLSQGLECQYSVATTTTAAARKQSQYDPSTPELHHTGNMDFDFASFDHGLLDLPSPSDAPFVAANFDYSSLSWQEFLAMTAEGEPLRTLPMMDTNCIQSLRFLDRFTSKTGFVASFDCGTEYQRARVLLPAAVPSSISWLNNPLSLKTHHIMLLVKEVVTIKPRNSAVSLDWSPVLEQMCLEFFSPSNLQRYLDLYWAFWHPNVNIVHRPSFNAVQAKPAVLATMAVIGACVSPDLVDNDNAQVWFNCVEELVFIDEDFNSNFSFSSGSGNFGAYRSKIQALQAAYMVCLYQTWEGDDASKRRVRRNRFATLVSTARDIGMPMARHANYSQQSRCEFDWMRFAVCEEFVRLLTWTFLLDTAFTIFNNLPPRMVIKEMKIHTAVPEACFQAAAADECYEQIQLWLPPDNLYWRVSHCSAFQMICNGKLEVDACDALAALGPLNLFVLTSAIHSLIFQYRNSYSWGCLDPNPNPNLNTNLLSPVHHALNNWKVIWQHFASSLVSGISPHVTVDHNHNHNELEHEAMWKRVGFCSYCPEYWLLASLMTDKMTARTSSSSPTGTGTGNPGTMHELGLGLGLGRLDDGPLDSILNKYDQTSMRQVNDLILSLSDFRIAG
ncbi:uncharacterized protein BDV14DRAFT_211935 [Aspergillus stella-maris]|uniref:uncharacterized protein n=1 Tax=Aspergillus stella-maris TaxID=1810926 RepID=UPI003CCDACD0